MRSTVIKATKTAGFLLLATFANPLTAATTTDYNEGWYLGGNIGLSFANIDEDTITQNITDPSYTDDESDLGYKLFGGYQFNKYFALEGGYFNLGKFNYDLSSPTGTASGTLKVMGVNLDALALLPITENFAAFARVGANYAQVKDSFSSSGSLSFSGASPKEKDFNYKFGAGLQYAMTDTVGFRLEAERYRINDAVGNDGDIDLFSIGFTYRFGVSQEVVPVVEHKEVIVPVVVIAPEPKEEEVIVIVTEPLAQEKIKESVTQKKTVAIVFEGIHFGFDKSTLSQEAKDALKRNIAQLGENPDIKMLVEGHTSLSGTEKYNQALSERRAQAVKDYLVEEKLFSAEKIAVVGYGKTKPVEYEAKPESKVYSEAAKANMRVILKIMHK